MGLFQSKPTDPALLIPRSPDDTRAVASKFAINENLKRIASELAAAGLEVVYPRLCSVEEDAVLNKEYHDARACVFSYVDAGYPYLIIVPKNAQEVAKALGVVAPLKGTVPLCINGGGHSSQSMRTETIVFALNKYLRSVKVDREARRVVAGGGCKIGEVDAACRGTGLAYVTGTNVDTGVVGLSLVGGVGFLSRKYGMACDQIVEAEVALADGTLVRVNDADERHKDLMRALRGGSSNFGIVTEITLELVPVGTGYCGVLINITPTKNSCFTLARAWHDHVQTKLPVEGWSGLVFVGKLPVNPILATYVNPDPANTSPPPQAFTHLAELPGRWAVLNKGELVKPKDYHTDLQTMLGEFGKPGYYVQSGFYVPTISDALLEVLWKSTRDEAPNSKCAILLFSLGGKGAQGVEGRPSCVSNFRKAQYWVVVEASFDRNQDEGTMTRVRAWVRTVRERIFASVPGVEMSLYPWIDVENTEVVFKSEEEKRTFLKDVKRRYDPNNGFRCNSNIVP